MARRDVAMVRCVTCGGEYAPVQPDGMQYFHVCPPIECVAVKQPDGSIAVVPRQTRTVEEDDPKTGEKIFRTEYVLPAGVEGDVIAERTVERKGARNENPHPFDRDAAGKATIIAEGEGVEAVAAPKVEIIGVSDVA